MSRGSVFDYDAIGKRLKEIRGPDPMAPTPSKPYEPAPPKLMCECGLNPASECYCWYGCD